MTAPGRLAYRGPMPERLARLKLDMSRPGFYDEPAFLAAERTDPTLLEAYAAFVEARPLPEGYVQYARARVEQTASFLLKELRADGRKGACIDMSAAISRFLERQGVWNYIVTGAVTISFPASTGRAPKHFWPIGNGPCTPGASAAHMWVNAPPFRIVDLTLAMQPYGNGEERWLPDAILAEDPRPGEVELADLLDPEGRTELRRALRREPNLQDVKLINAGILDRVKKFGTWEYRHDGTQIRYVACAISAPDAPMETAKNLQLNGRYMLDLWREFENSVGPPTAPT